MPMSSEDSSRVVFRTSSLYTSSSLFYKQPRVCFCIEKVHIIGLLYKRVHRILVIMTEVTFTTTGANGLFMPSLGDAMHSFYGSCRFVKSESKTSVDMLYQVPTGVNFDKSFYGTKCLVKNVLNPIREITDKDRLYESMCSSGGRQYMTTTVDVTGMNTVHPGTVYIVKPTGSRTGAGRGNTVVSSTAELQEATTRLKNEGFDGGIACIYVTNPLLFEGYKTHFRMFLMVRPQVGKLPFMMELWNVGLIRTAKEVYSNSDYLNANIHDTHAGTSIRDIYFPDETPPPTTFADVYSTMSDVDKMKFGKLYSEKILKAMTDALRPLEYIIRSRASVSQEARAGFEVYGVDFIVTDSQYPRAILLEINTKVSYRPAENYDSFKGDSTHVDYWSEGYHLFSRAYFKWILHKGYIPLLKEVMGTRGQAESMTLTQPSTPVKTYLITGGTGLEFDHLRHVLESAGYSQAPPNSQYVTFNYLEKLGDDLRNYDRQARSMKCKVKSVVDSKKNCIADKGMLSHNLRDTPYIARTWTTILHIPENVRDRPLIIKPVGDIADSGYGIVISSGRQDLVEKVRVVEKLIHDSKGKLEKYIISDYITNVDTFRGKKYHLRMYMLYMVSRTGRKWSMWNKGRIVTAANMYANADWTDASVHDTHSKSTSHNFYFPEDVDPQTARHTSNITEKMTAVCEVLFKVLETNDVRPYPESDYGFEVFGCDFLITDTFDPILLEVNSRVGMRNIGDVPGTKYSFSKFSKEYFDWLLGNVLPFIGCEVPLPKKIKGKDIDFKKVDSFTIPKTYTVSGNRGFDPTRLYDLFSKNGFIESTEDYVGVFILDQKFAYSAETEIRYDSDKAAATTCLLKNLLAIKDIRGSLCNKGALYAHLLKVSSSNKKYLPHSWRFNNATEKSLVDAVDGIYVKGPVIVKPVSVRAGGGKDIVVLGDAREMKDAVVKLWKIYKDVIVSRYVSNPVLLNVDGVMRKMHLRMYLMIVSPVKCKKCCPLTAKCKHSASIVCSECDHPSKECNMCYGRPYQDYKMEWLPVGRMFTAALPYVEGDYSNPGVHDTHNKTTPENFIFPDDLARCGTADVVFPEDDVPFIAETVINHINSIDLMDVVPDKMEWVYPESHFGYEIFGADFLLTRTQDGDCIPILLEINDRPGGAPCGFDEEPTKEVWARLHNTSSDTSDPNMSKFMTMSATFYQWVYDSAIKRVYSHFASRKRVTIDESQNTVLGIERNMSMKWGTPTDSESMEYSENLLGSIERGDETSTRDIYKITKYYEDYLPRLAASISTNNSITRVYVAPTAQYELVDTILENINSEHITHFEANGYLGSKIGNAVKKIATIVTTSPKLVELEIKDVSVSRSDMKILTECFRTIRSKKMVSSIPSDFETPDRSDTHHSWYTPAKLVLSGICMDSTSLKKLCIGLLKQPDVRFGMLDLSKNNLGEKGGKLLLSFLKRRPTICDELNIRCCQIPSKVVDAMWKIPLRSFFVEHDPNEKCDNIQECP